MLEITESTGNGVSKILESINKNKTIVILLISIMGNYIQYKYIEKQQNAMLEVKNEQIKMIVEQKRLNQEINIVKDTINKYK